MSTISMPVPPRPNPVPAPPAAVDLTAVDAEILRRDATLDELREQLRRMTPGQRRAAYKRRSREFFPCALWARMFPEEVPLIGGEYEFIAELTPEYAEARG